MGVKLGGLVEAKKFAIDDLAGRKIAMDGHNILYQFLAIIRSRQGEPLKDREGRVTSHLSGLIYRNSNLMEAGLRVAYVFDGVPHRFKTKVVRERTHVRREAKARYEEAVREGRPEEARRYAQRAATVNTDIIADAKRLLTLMGVPWVQAPGEGEAQSSHMARKGDVWAASTRDYDSLLFGAPRLVRYLTIQGREWLPSKGRSRKLEPELIELSAFLGHHGIIREQLVDLAILVGTDFNQGLKGIGPKTALKLVREHGRLEEMPEEVASRLPEKFNQIRQIYLEPEITDDYETEGGALDEEGLYSFLCGERSFSRDRVETVVERMRRSQRQRDLTDWMKGGA